MNIDQSEKKAIVNILGAINIRKAFPANVFCESWDNFFFLPSDYIFEEDFFAKILRFISIEKSKIFCLINIDKFKNVGPDATSVKFFDGKASSRDFYFALKDGGPATGWLYGIDSYGCASDVGEWCFFCDKENDVAVLGFAKHAMVEKYSDAVAQLGAVKIDQLATKRINAVFPFNSLTTEWERELVRNYADVGSIN